MIHRSQEYTCERGYPTEETVQRAYDDAGLIRAIQLYKQLVSGFAIFARHERVGIVARLNVEAGRTPQLPYVSILGKMG